MSNEFTLTGNEGIFFCEACGHYCKKNWRACSCKAGDLGKSFMDCTCGGCTSPR